MASQKTEEDKSGKGKELMILERMSEDSRFYQSLEDLISASQGHFSCMHHAVVYLGNQEDIFSAFTSKHIEIHQSVQKIRGKLIEITEQKVVLQCLINEDGKEFQTRRFDKEPFEGVVPLVIGTFVEIIIYTKPGERRFVYKQINGDSIKHLFEPENIFEEFVGSPFFNPLPSVNEDQL